jgi:putative nucleotidyltransferase with HDIG domain
MSLAATREGDDPQTRWTQSTEAPVKRILFVDPEPTTFHSLSDAMSRSDSKWQVVHFTSADEALESLEAESAEVVVADEILAGTDGVTLLTRVRDRHPTTIRMILSASAGSSRPSVAAIVAHRLLAKPCNPEELGMMIRRSCDLHKLSAQAETLRKTMAAAALPSRPGVYMELNRVLSDPNWQPSQISMAVERDVAMSAKVLQLANSALFGLANAVTSVRDAVVYLGVDTIRSLALTAEAFGKMTPRNAEGFSFDEFQAHAMLVARITAAILPVGRTQQEAVTAALLHDIGKLVLISDGGSRWTMLNGRAASRKLPLHLAEKQCDGITHADIGAHLLTVWGLPDGIAEAVAHHHTPLNVESLTLDPVVAVHIADALAHEVSPAHQDGVLPPSLDAELIARLGLGARLELWRHQTRQLVQAAEAGR